MSSPRARANHKLYLAKIQLQAWHNALATQQVAATTLAQAFLPAVRMHLLDAYGWFLLAVSGEDTLPERPPHSTAELPPVSQGRAVCGEVLEFRQLEQGGWLAELLLEADDITSGPRSAGNLASAGASVVGPEVAGQWLEQLAGLFGRMGDSLDEC